MREPLDYNEYDPETCLEDNIFNLIWLFYMTHKVPRSPAGDMLLSILSISRRRGLLYPYELYDPHKVSSKDLDRLSKKYSVRAALEIQVGEFVFWMFDTDGTFWRARRFATPDDPSGLYNLENIKHLLKRIAVEEGILPEEV